MTRPLNILQVISDQHMADAMGCAGHLQAITPSMDRLAQRGIRFTRAYTQNPICTPSRVSILSGQYCHNHGYYGLSGPTPANLPSFFGHFAKHGYRTAAVGKLHLPNTPRNWLQDELDLWACAWGGHHRGQGAGPYPDYLQSKGLLDAEDVIGFPELPRGGIQRTNYARPSNLQWDDCVEGWTVNRCIDFINRAGDDPWIMQCSFFRPHQCYTPDRRFWDMYDEDLALPEAWGMDIAHRPPHFRKMVEQARFDEATAKLVWRGYLACITHVDHALGLMLDHLETIGQLDRTVVVYHSDHGAYSTQFGVPEKAPGICSEQVCRVPYVWFAPGVTKGSTTCEQLVQNIDLGPTFASLTGLPEMDWADGRDITPLLEGRQEPVHSVVVTENVWSKSIRFGPWRYVHYQREMFNDEDVGELYHIDNDPLEKHNLYDEANHQSVVQEARVRLLNWLIQTTRATTVHPGMAGTCGQAADGKLPNRAGPGQQVNEGQHYL